MAYPPLVKTKMGPGHLFKIYKNIALVEYDYMYLVEMPLEDVDLTGVDLKRVVILKNDDVGEISRR